ncbi:MAG: hypothetical protein Q9223_003369 [Gallowayella weberi]
MATSILISYILATIPSLAVALPPATSQRQTVTGTINLANFNFPADQARVNHLVSAFNDALTLIHTVIDTHAWDSPTYDLYFPPASRNNVSSVFQKILAGASTQVTFDNNDRPYKTDPEHRDACTVIKGVAFTHNKPSKPIVHFCESFWSIPSLDDVATKVCGSSEVALDMRFAGSIMLHEFSPTYPIRDITYGPFNTPTLRKTTPTDAEFNADNYMWFATETHWRHRCTRYFNPPSANCGSGGNCR